MPGRRTLLRTGALSGLAVIGGIAALPSSPDRTGLDGTVEATPVPDRVDSWTDEAIVDESASPIARYQYRRTHDGFEPTAPINVVLVPNAPTDDAGLDRVLSVLEDEGWLRDPEEYTRYAWDRESESFVRQQATAAETYYGASGRFHVRCWSFDGIVSMQAHEDTGPRPKHGIDSYDRGRELVEAIFDDDGWNVAPSAIDLDNAAQDYDGVASVVTEER